MKNNKLSKALIKLNLTPLASDIYQLLLDDTEISITTLCSGTGQYRAKVYEALEELKGIGLVSRENDFSRKISVQTPTAVFSLLKQKQYEINRSVVELQDELPYILANYHDQKKSLDVRVFDGENKFIYLLTTILDECRDNEQMVSFGENDDLYRIINSKYFFDIWVPKRIEKSIFNRILSHPNNTFVEREKQFDTQKLRKCKILPKSYSNQGCYWIVGSKIIFWDTVTPKAILIENRILADVLRFNFELVWQSL